MRKKFLDLFSAALAFTFCASCASKVAEFRNVKPFQKPPVQLAITDTENNPLQAITSTIYKVEKDSEGNLHRYLREFRVVLDGLALTQKPSIELHRIATNGTPEIKKEEGFEIEADIRSSTSTQMIFKVKTQVASFGDTDQQTFAGQYRVVALSEGEEIASGNFTIFDFAFTNITKNESGRDTQKYKIGEDEKSGLDQLGNFSIFNCNNDSDIVYISSSLPSNYVFAISVEQLGITTIDSPVDANEEKFSYPIRNFVKDKVDGFLFTAKITVKTKGKSSPNATDSISFKKVRKAS